MSGGEGLNDDNESRRGLYATVLGRVSVTGGIMKPRGIYPDGESTLSYRGTQMSIRQSVGRK